MSRTNLWQNNPPLHTDTHTHTVNANTTSDKAIHYIKDKHFFLELSQLLENEKDQKNVLQDPQETPRPSVSFYLAFSAVWGASQTPT